jgi:hypothetical protein
MSGPLALSMQCHEVRFPFSRPLTLIATRACTFTSTCPYTPCLRILISPESFHFLNKYVLSVNIFDDIGSLSYLLSEFPMAS